MNRRSIVGVIIAALAVGALGMARLASIWMGRQPNGSFIVSTGQRIEGGAIAFDGRPIDLALHPLGKFYAVLNKNEILLGTAEGIIPGSSIKLGGSAGFHGLIWSPDGQTLVASTERGHLLAFPLKGETLDTPKKIEVRQYGKDDNPVPGGMTFNHDGTRLFVTAANRNAVVELNGRTYERVAEHRVQTLPFEVKLTDDETTLLVSNWGGRLPAEGDRVARSEKLKVVVDSRGVPATGTVSIIDLKSKETKHVEVGIHPTSIVIRGKFAYVANAMSDTISEINIKEAKVARTFALRWGQTRVIGGMPNALALRGDTLYVGNGGDNALVEVNLPTGLIRGYRPAGYFPSAVALAADGTRAFVLNTKGNGSVRRTSRGLPGNAHDFQGTVSVVDLTSDIARATEIVARNNRWEATPALPKAKVYNGAIKHVIYIIKENRTYDEVFGDLPQGNGAKALCSLGERIMPNHRKIAQEFTLFDNGYVSGTNSADGHAWSTQSLANEYLEHFYVGYSRTYPDDGDDAMALSSGGALWDAAAKKGLRIRVYGEFCDNNLAVVEPQPKNWFEAWEDRKNGTNKFKWHAQTRVAGLQPYIHPNYFYWPLLMSDQHRADIFLKDYETQSKADTVPNLMIVSLPCDHGEGLDPSYPTPRAMMADNDLALGRIIEGVSKSPQWKETCIFVIEDDAQSGPDHVDGHRTVFMAISPYSKRKAVDSTLYTTTHMIRSIEMMLGLDPMNKFDLFSEPMVACFNDELDLTPYKAVPNNTPLDERNPSGLKLGERDRFWQEKSLSLDWSHIDGPDPYWLNRINWYSIYKDTVPYPGRPGEVPGKREADDDDDDD